MNRPSRGLRESATTIRYTGRFVVPIRLSRIFTTRAPSPLTVASNSELRRIQVLQLTQHARLATHTLAAALATQCLEHALHLVESLEQTVHIGDGRAAAGGDALAPRSLDHLGAAAFLRCHGQNDRLHATDVTFRRDG